MDSDTTELTHEAPEGWRALPWRVFQPLDMPVSLRRITDDFDWCAKLEDVDAIANRLQDADPTVSVTVASEAGSIVIMARRYPRPTEVEARRAFQAAYEAETDRRSSVAKLKRLRELMDEFPEEVAARAAQKKEASDEQPC